MITCSKCKEEKEETEYYANKRASSGYHACCKSCYRSYDQRYYAGNRESVLRRTSMQRLELRKWYIARKAGACADCHELYHPVCMQFDHKPGTVKVDCVSDMVKALKPKSVIEEEIAKCELVCANCHALRTWTRLQEVELI